MVCSGSIDEAISECVPDCMSPASCEPCIEKVLGSDFKTCCQCIQWFAQTYNIPDFNISC
jgi:hypothetical protein